MGLRPQGVADCWAWGYPSRDSLACMGNKAAAAIGRWAMAIFPALVLLVGGLSKFTAADTWEADFESWGYDVRLVPVLGVVEILAAIAMVIPKTRFYGAGLIVAIMLGASVTRFLAGQVGPGVFTLAVAVVAYLSGWWARPAWFEQIVANRNGRRPSS